MVNRKSDKKILVFYIGVKNVNYDTIGRYITEVSQKITPEFFDGTVIFIPELESDRTKIECINPKYITDTDLIEENNKMLKKLNNHIEKQIKLLNDEK
jgi:hypothetical protein